MKKTVKVIKKNGNKPIAASVKKTGGKKNC